MISNVTSTVADWGSWAVSGVSNVVYSSIQRVVAVSVLTNQRFNFYTSSIKDLEQRRLSIMQPDPLKEPLLEAQMVHPDPIEVKVPTPSGHLLDGIVLPYVSHYRGSEINPKIDGRLFVCFSGVGGCYEKWFNDGLKDLRDHFKASLLMVNYRGVGRSTGTVTTPEDLFEDGYSIARFALDRLALDPAKVHIYGTSMGGGVAVNVTKRLEKEGFAPPTVCIDRSYSSLVETVYEALPLPGLKSLVCSIMRYACWQIDSVTSALSLKNSKLVVIRSSADRVIPPQASLATELENRTEGVAGFKVIDLPHEEKTELEKIEDPDFPKEQREYLKNTYMGNVALLAMKVRSIYQKLWIGFNAHLTPFSKKLYPAQCLIYEQILQQAEDRKMEKELLRKLE